VVWHIWFCCLLGITSLIGLVMFRGIPSLATVGWLCFFAGIVALLYEPRYGVYQIIGLALAGDGLLTPWFPFTKNLSSVESLLYLGRAMVFSPAEIFMVLTFVSWLGRAEMHPNLQALTGPLFWPQMIFAGFITYGWFIDLAHNG